MEKENISNWWIMLIIISVFASVMKISIGVNISWLVILMPFWIPLFVISALCCVFCLTYAAKIVIEIVHNIHKTSHKPHEWK